MTNEIGDVWELETPEEKKAVDNLDGIITCAITGDPWARNYLARLWDED